MSALVSLFFWSTETDSVLECKEWTRVDWVLRVLGIDLAYSVVLFQNFFLSARKKQLAVKQARKEVPPAGNHSVFMVKTSVDLLLWLYSVRTGYLVNKVNIFLYTTPVFIIMVAYRQWKQINNDYVTVSAF